MLSTDGDIRFSQHLDQWSLSTFCLYQKMAWLDYIKVLVIGYSGLDILYFLRFSDIKEIEVSHLFIIYSVFVGVRSVSGMVKISK